MFDIIKLAFSGLSLPLLQPPAHLGSRNPLPEGKNAVKSYIWDKYPNFMFSLVQLTCEQSTLNHQSQTKYCWLNRVPLGQRKRNLRCPLKPSDTQMWNCWHSPSGSA
jgi:hypothetical protein